MNLPDPNCCPHCEAEIVTAGQGDSISGNRRCPVCDALLWFLRHPHGRVYYDRRSPVKQHLRRWLAEQMSVEAMSLELDELTFQQLGVDSLDTVELIMELEEEFDRDAWGDGDDPPLSPA